MGNSVPFAVKRGTAAQEGNNIAGLPAVIAGIEFITRMLRRAKSTISHLALISVALLALVIATFAWLLEWISKTLRERPAAAFEITTLPTLSPREVEVPLEIAENASSGQE
jgi:hypothetical protein